MDTNQKIKDLIKKIMFVLFMKGTPDPSVWFFNDCFEHIKTFEC